MATATLRTVEDLMGLDGDPGRFDLIDGEISRMAPASGHHGGIAGTLSRVVGNFVFDRDLGTVYTAETGFILRRDPDSVLVPDLAYVTADRLPPLDDQVGFLALAPDLAIEIISPSETARRVAAKVAAYLDAGCRLVWVVEPRQRTVTAWTPDRQSRVFRADETLDGGDVLPGFTVPLANVFSPSGSRGRSGGMGPGDPDASPTTPTRGVA